MKRLTDNMKGILIVSLTTFIQIILRFFVALNFKFPFRCEDFISHIIIFILTTFFVYKISRKIFKHSIYAIFACILNGTSIISLDSHLYPFVYELSNLFILIATYLHLILWKKKNVNFLNLLPIFITFVLGSLIHYSFVIYAVVLLLIYSIQCLKNKNFCNLIKYTICVLLSVITVSLLILFVFDISICSNVSINLNFDKLHYLNVINKKFFNSFFILFVILIGIICFKKKDKNVRGNSSIYLIALPILIYSLFIILFSPVVLSMYFIPIYSNVMLLILYVTKKYLLEHLTNKETIFLLILLTTIFSYNYLLCSQHLTTFCKNSPKHFDSFYIINLTVGK